MWTYKDILIKYYIEKKFLTKLMSTDQEVLYIKLGFSINEDYY